jgi:hypothetical protein
VKTPEGSQHQQNGHTNVRQRYKVQKDSAQWLKGGWQAVKTQEKL